MRSVDEILEDALALPAEARAAIASSLISSLDDTTDLDDLTDEEVEDLWSAEIARRIAEIDAGRVQLVPWSEVRHRVIRDEAQVIAVAHARRRPGDWRTR